MFRYECRSPSVNFAYPWKEGIFGALRVSAAMIGITISGKAYAALSPTLPAGLAIGDELVPDREYQLWLPRSVVNGLRAQRAPGETFSDVILRLAARGSFAALTR